MKLTLITLVIFVFSLNQAFAQVYDPVTYKEGRLSTSFSYTEVEGTPFLFDFWLSGEARSSLRNELYKPIQLKYNVIDDKLIFLSDDQKVMDFVNPIKSFVLFNQQGQPLNFRNGFPKYAGFESNAYYQVLADGKLVLLKKFKKSIQEAKEFNSANVKKKFNDSQILLVSDGKKLVEVGKDKNALSAMFLDRKNELDSFLSKEKVNPRKEKDILKAIEYYNTL